MAARARWEGTAGQSEMKKETTARLGRTDEMKRKGEMKKGLIGQKKAKEGLNRKAWKKSSVIRTAR